MKENARGVNATPRKRVVGIRGVLRIVIPLHSAGDRIHHADLHERPIDDAESEPSGDVDIDLPIGSNGEGMLAGGSARTQVIDADGGGLGRPWEEALRRGICTDNGETQVRLRRTAMATRR